MILLTGANDVLRLVTSSTANLDVVAGFADYASGTITPGRSLTTISTATTTTVVSAPGASTQRTVRYLSIRNRHASTANTVTVQVFDGSTAFEVYKVTLAAGEALVYDEAAGFSYVNAQGLPRTASSLGSSSPAVTTTNLVVLASDVVNNNGTANSIADVTGLSFPVISGETYWFEFLIAYTSAATATGSRWSINGPSVTTLAYTAQWSLTATTVTITGGAVAYDIPAASNATSAQQGTTGGNVAWLSGLIRPSADGNVIARFASEVANSAITAKAGSICRWVRTL